MFRKSYNVKDAPNHGNAQDRFLAFGPQHPSIDTTHFKLSLQSRKAGYVLMNLGSAAFGELTASTLSP